MKTTAAGFFHPCVCRGKEGVNGLRTDDVSIKLLGMSFTAKYVTAALAIWFGYQCSQLFAPLLPGMSLALLWFAAVCGYQRKLALMMKQVKASAKPAAVLCAAVSVPLLLYAIQWHVMSKGSVLLAIVVLLVLLLGYVLPAVSGNEDGIAGIVLWLVGVLLAVVPLLVLSVRLKAEIEDLLASLASHSSDPQLSLRELHRVAVGGEHVSRLKLALREDLGLPVSVLEKILPYFDMEFEDAYERVQDLVAALLAHEAVNNFGLKVATSMTEQITLVGGFTIWLLYMLQNRERLLAYLASLSPFPAEQTRVFAHSLQDSAQRILLCDFGIFLVHFALALTTFALVLPAGFPIWTFATIAGVLGVLPVLSPSLVWIGVGLACYLKGEGWVVSISLLLMYVVIWLLVQPLLYSIIPTGHYFLSSSAILLGLARYGAVGIFIGPSILCAFLVVLELVQYEFRA